MSNAPQDDVPVQLPPSVRLLQWLVIGLTASLILGVLAVVVVIVIRFAAPPTPVLPEDLVLPAGMQALSVTLGSDWLGVVTMDDHILIYDRTSGQLRQTITLSRP